jgi:hypothetical protein
MSYLVIAAGALLALCGALAIGWGYPIIQVERGWASVIAGSTALSCGAVTIALGLILHRLSGLSALVKSWKGAMQAAREPDGSMTGAVAPDLELAPGFEAAMPSGRGAAPAAPPVAPGSRPWPLRAARPGLGSARNALKPRPVLAPAARAQDSDQEPLEPPAAWREDLSGPQGEERPPLELGKAWAESAAEMWPRPASERETASKASGEVASEPLLHETDETREEEPVEQQLEGVPFAASEPGVQPEAQAELASIEAILREELGVASDIPLETRAESAAEDSAAHEAAGVTPPFPRLSEAKAASESQAFASGPEPPAVPIASDEPLTIVGRYESEGTSYVMYSDGSVEARTEHAVFHFKSMSELKTFMDSQAQVSRD